MSAERFRASAITDPGGRAQNEDAYLSRSDLGLWAVADGAGGHASGATASRAVVTALETIPPGLTAAEMLAQVRLRLGSVHASLLAEAAENAKIIASTVVVLIARGEHFACLWAGDSRAYRLRNDMLDQLTSDHSLVQSLVEDGAITEAEAERHPEANVITRAVGDGSDELGLDKVAGDILAGDRFLLCSDGLHKALPAPELARLLAEDAAAAPLVAAALGRGSSDNVTAVVVEVEEDERGPVGAVESPAD
jgi:serine/threonine protein phosphatase PrpC